MSKSRESHYESPFYDALPLSDDPAPVRLREPDPFLRRDDLALRGGHGELAVEQPLRIRSIVAVVTPSAGGRHARRQIDPRLHQMSRFDVVHEAPVAPWQPLAHGGRRKAICSTREA